MRTAIVTGGIALALTLHSPAAAQMVEAGVVVRSGPVVGHVVVADPAPVYHERRVVVRRYAPRVVVVEQVRVHRGRGWWKRHGYRPVVVYYDVRHRRFYDGWDRDRRGIREVVVYERRGRYYTADDHWRDDRRYHGDDDWRDDRRYHGDDDWRDRD